MSDRFADAAVRLAGRAGVMFGWAPEQFWAATPAELAALVTVLCEGERAGLDGGELARLREALGDG